MRSRWVVVSALVVAVGLAWAGAATTDSSKSAAPCAATVQSSQAAPASDPYLGASSISTKAPDERKPCTFFNSDCANRPDGQHCGPQLGHCLCSVTPTSYSCVSGGPIG